MSKRDLEQKLSKYDLLPQLAVHYKNATEKIYGVKIFSVGNKNMFMLFERKLRKLDIENRDYTYAVLKILRSWVKKNNMDHVPPNTFCSEWALKKYIKIIESESVEISTSDEDMDNKLFYDELLVARHFIYLNKQHPIKISDVVERLRPMLGEEWLHMYDCGKAREVKGKVIDFLSEEYGFEASRYIDFVGHK